MVEIIVGGTLDHIAIIIIGVPVGYDTFDRHNGEAVGVIELFINHPVVGVKFTVDDRIASQAANGVAFRIVVFFAVDIPGLVICIVHPAVGFPAGGHGISKFIIPALGDHLVLAHLPNSRDKSVLTHHRVSEVIKPGFGDQVS